MYIYCITNEYSLSYGYVKIGLTINPLVRLKQYNTGDAPGIKLEKYYLGIWKVKSKTRDELYNIEKMIHNKFEDNRIKNQFGNYSEWFNVKFEDIQEYIKSQEFFEEEINVSKINELFKYSNEDYDKEIEITKFKPVYKTIKKDSKQKFFELFIGKLSPRRIQTELWDIWSEICKNDKPYSGIVQWATGSGKTIAMMILLYHSLNQYKETGRIFRGLIICPKNDIIETLKSTLQLFKKFGVEVFEGHNGKLMTLNIPSDKHILVITTHSSLTEDKGWNKLPKITHIHYDEVHRITGEEFRKIMISKIQEWNVQYITGTSATPKTCNILQHEKMNCIFGKDSDNLNIIHKCNIDEAVENKWIATPRFGLYIISKSLKKEEIIKGYIDMIINAIEEKKMKYNKIIAYLDTIEDVKIALETMKIIYPDINIYSAIYSSDYKSDKEFVKVNPTAGNINILFACERYREGSDIRGIEMTTILIGDSIASNVLLQVAGRALRNDYEGKEGWCYIMRPSEPYESEDDILYNLITKMISFMNDKEQTRKNIEGKIRTCFNNVSIHGKMIDIEETVRIVQAMYDRKEFEKGTVKEKYEVVRNINIQLGLKNKTEYYMNKLKHTKFIENPEVYFVNDWVSWYDFLGVNTESYPSTKQEFVKICKSIGLTKENYKEKRIETLPEEPAYMYGNYTNWDDEFGIIDDIGF